MYPQKTYRRMIFQPIQLSMFFPTFLVKSQCGYALGRRKPGDRRLRHLAQLNRI